MSNELDFDSCDNLKSRGSLRSVTRNSCKVFIKDSLDAKKASNGNHKSRMNNLLRMRVCNLSISMPNLVKALRSEIRTRKSCHFYLKNAENSKVFVRRRRCISSSIPCGLNNISETLESDAYKKRTDTRSLKSSDSNTSTISNLLPSPNVWPQYGSVKRKAFCLANAETIDQTKVSNSAENIYDRETNGKALGGEHQSKPGIEVLTLISVWIRNSPKDFYGNFFAI